MSLSEESGGDDKRSRGKKMKETKRSASVSSHEFESPASSPYMSSRNQETTKLVSTNIVEQSVCLRSCYVLSVAVVEILT